MKKIGAYIEPEDFDREYGLADLLPLPLVEALLSDIDKDVAAAVVFADGRLYCGGKVAWRNSQPHSQPKRDTAAKAERLSSTDGPVKSQRFNLDHEMETIGYLVLEARQGATADGALERFGPFAARALNRMIYLGYQLRMTAGLHGQVVSDSYLHLKEKARQLARSEEKYRLLAENLEQEVARKTREISDTQVLMLQQEKMASVGQLAAGMAHEINNPIGFLISNLNTLRANTGDMSMLIGEYQRFAKNVSAAQPVPEKSTLINRQLSALDTLRESMDLDFIIEDSGTLIDESIDGAKRVKNIVQSLRDFTHPGIDGAESVDLNHCLDTTLVVLSSQVTADINIHRDYRPLPNMQCRLREMNQAFFNLLKNALQAVAGAGAITIRTRSGHEGVEISISDSGPGMDSAILRRIFEPFFTTREVGSGAGLGLTQAYNTVKSHGGTLSVKSVVGKGSTFTVNLPIRPRSEKAM